jgi:superfamily II RNA helicase
MAEGEVGLDSNGWFSNNLCGAVAAWTENEDWNDIIRIAEIPEGDFVNVCRRTTDLLRQVRNACPEDIHLKNKLNRCISRIDKGIVSLGL